MIRKVILVLLLSVFAWIPTGATGQEPDSISLYIYSHESDTAKLVRVWNYILKKNRLTKIFWEGSRF